MASETDIINVAAVYLSEGRAIDPSTDEGETMRTLSFMYPQARLKVLRGHFWGSAKEDVQISADTTPPPFLWGLQYTLPIDFVRMVSFQDVDIDQLIRPLYVIKGRKLQTNEAAPISVTYIKDLTEVGTMDPMLTEAISLRLAADCAIARTDSLPLARSLEERYARHLSEAKHVDSMERRKTIIDPFVGSSWDNAHFGGGV